MKTLSKNSRLLLAGAMIAVVPGAAMAKDPVAAQANKVAAEAQDLQQASNKLDAEVANAQGSDDTTANRTDNDNDNDGDRGDHDDGHGNWGLLGLLGLAGLLGLRRRDHDHVHYDRRDDLDATRTGRRAGTDTTDTRL